mgnify:CR=1 FL=1
MITPLDFEKNVHELESKLNDLRNLSHSGDVNMNEEIERLKKKVEKSLKDLYANLDSWQIVQVARHPGRPNFLDYVEGLTVDFTPLAGDRNFAEDPAIIGGLCRFRGQSIVILGQQKGQDTESRLKHNFGMARPEGYRKARRLMEIADKFNLPLITLVDTAGAHPGIGAEERGQAEAIARCIETMSNLKVPVISTIIGEGGSGGAIAIAVGNVVMMLEYSIYSTISPEGCASILWRTVEKKKEAAKALKMTAADLKALNVIDCIIKEPLGGAHRYPQQAIASVGDAIEKELKKLALIKPEELKQQRHAKFLSMGRTIGL